MCKVDSMQARMYGSSFRATITMPRSGSTPFAGWSVSRCGKWHLVHCERCSALGSWLIGNLRSGAIQLVAADEHAEKEPQQCRAAKGRKRVEHVFPGDTHHSSDTSDGKCLILDGMRLGRGQRLPESGPEPRQPRGESDDAALGEDQQILVVHYPQPIAYTARQVLADVEWIRTGA